MIKDIIGYVSSGSTGTYGTVRFGTSTVRFLFGIFGSESGQDAKITPTVRHPPHPWNIVPSWRERVCACDIARRALWRALCGPAHTRTREAGVVR